MAVLKAKRPKIYQSGFPIFITLFILVIPFLFLLLFAQFAGIATKELFIDLFTSVGRISAAYIIAAILGWFLAVFFYQGRRALIALPIFDVLQSFPTFAALPLAIFLWGPSNATIIFFLVLTIIWPILFSIISSLKLIKYDWEEAVEIAGLRGFNYFRLFLLPVTIPGFITGSIIGLGEGWEAVVAVELIVKIQPGLGNFFELFSHNIPVTTFGILGFLIFIFSINKILWIPALEWSHKKMEG